MKKDRDFDGSIIMPFRSFLKFSVFILALQISGLDSFARETNGLLEPDSNSYDQAPAGSCQLIGNVFYTVSFAGDHNRVIPLDRAMNMPRCPQLRTYDAVKDAYKKLFEKFGLNKVQVASMDTINLIRLAQKTGNCECKRVEVLCTDDATKEKTYFSIDCQH